MPTATRDYKGYIKELLLYPYCLTIHKRHPIKKFLIYGFPRSGSTLLVSLLDAHPDIHCEGELLIHPLFDPRRYIDCNASICRKEIFGFKLLVDHFETQNIESPATFLSSLVQSGYLIINLVRRNLFRAALSSLYASFIGKTHIKKTDGEIRRIPMHVDPTVLLRKIKRFEDLEYNHSISLKDFTYQTICYEDDLLTKSKQQATVDRICEYLRIASAPVDTNILRTTSDDVEDFVENYAEISASLENSEYERFLSD